jgi:hypothetical protein
LVEQRIRNAKVGGSIPLSGTTAEEIGAECAFQLLAGDVFKILLNVLFGRIVHQHVDAAEAIQGLADDLLGEGGITDIAGNAFTFAASGLYQFACGIGIVVFVQIGDQHICAFMGESDRYGPADTAVSASDDGDLVAQLARALVVRANDIRARLHVGFDTGLAGLMLRGKRLAGLLGHIG